MQETTASHKLMPSDDRSSSHFWWVPNSHGILNPDWLKNRDARVKFDDHFDDVENPRSWITSRTSQLLYIYTRVVQKEPWSSHSLPCVLPRKCISLQALHSLPAAAASSTPVPWEHKFSKTITTPQKPPQINKDILCMFIPRILMQ